MADDPLRELRTVQERGERAVRAQIRAAAAAGATSQQIAEAIGVSRATLWRHYGEELRRGRDEAAGAG